jgi:hypothetical protein
MPFCRIDSRSSRYSASGRGGRTGRAVSFTDGLRGDDRRAAYRSGPDYAMRVRRESSLTVLGLGLDALLPKPEGR